MSSILENEIEKITEGDYLADKAKIYQLTADVAVKFGMYIGSTGAYLFDNTEQITHSESEHFFHFINNIYKP